MFLYLVAVFARRQLFLARLRRQHLFSPPILAELSRHCTRKGCHPGVLRRVRLDSSEYLRMTSLFGLCSSPGTNSYGRLTGRLLQFPPIWQQMPRAERHSQTLVRLDSADVRFGSKGATIMRPKCGQFAWIVMLAAMSLEAAQVHGQIWKQFVPTSRGSASGNARTTRESGDTRSTWSTADAGPTNESPEPRAA